MAQSFWNKNKVFILGLMSALAMAVTPFIQEGHQSEAVKWTTVGYAALIATLSYFAKNWRGQGLSIFGVIGSAAGVIGNLLASGSSLNDQTFYVQLVLQTFVGVIAAAGSDPKGRMYEQQPAIRDAKIQAEIEQPAAMINGEIKQIAKDAK